MKSNIFLFYKQSLAFFRFKHLATLQRTESCARIDESPGIDLILKWSDALKKRIIFSVCLSVNN